MSTHALVKFYDEDNDGVLVTVYHHLDGYLSGVGFKLVQFLKEYTIVNGISMNETRVVANGMGCLAAQYIAKVKDGPGGVYISYSYDDEDYIYVVKYVNEQLTVNDLSLADFEKTCQEED